MLSRRQFVHRVLGLGAVAALPSTVLQAANVVKPVLQTGLVPGTEVPSLNQIATGAGRLFGSAFDMASINDQQYGQLLKHHCGILTTDYQFKFATLRWREHEISYAKTDRLMAFARGAGVLDRLAAERQQRQKPSLRAKGPCLSCQPAGLLTIMRDSTASSAAMANSAWRFRNGLKSGNALRISKGFFCQ